MTQGTRWRSVRAEGLDDGAFLRIVLDAGKGNVLDLPAIRELRELAGELGELGSLRGIVLDHEGPDFSFGASVPDHAPAKVGEMLPELGALARDLLGLSIPILASVRGRCLGGGLELAALADRTFASQTALFGQPEVKLGVFAPIGSLLLPRLVGPRCAADLLLSGRTMDAGEALAAGLVAEVVADPTEAALAWAREHLAPKSATALRFATGAARRTWIGPFLSGLEELEGVYLQELMSTHDACEGIAAFLEKRDPRWEDR